MSLLLLFVGLVLLVAGAEWLVRGASRLASRLGLSTLVIGLTVVAYGTSAPELAVSIQAALNGQPDLSVGNVAGSNIFNILFILGISAAITPLAVNSQVIRMDVWVMLGVSIGAMLLALDGVLGRVEGAILLFGAVLYTAWTIREGQRAGQPPAEESESSSSSGGSIFREVMFIAAGLALLVAGSRALVSGAVDLARGLGVSELLIGLTVVAAGTSLPEVATSIMAAFRGQRDIAVGNVVGSNIFNILAVLGASASFGSRGIAISTDALYFDFPVMIGASIGCLPIFFTGRRIDRWEGLVMVAYYVAYTVYLVLHSEGGPALALFRAAMLWFVLPLTAVTLVALTWRHQRQERLE